MASSSSPLPQSIRLQLMEQATRALSKYNGVLTSEDLIASLALTSVRAGAGESPDALLANNRGLNSGASKEEQAIMRVFLDDCLGSYSMAEVIEELNRISKSSNVDSADLKQKIINTFQIYYEQKNDNGLVLASIRSMLGSSEDSIINRSISSPRKGVSPGLSIALINSSRISFNKRFEGPTTIMFNGIPNIELSRISPYLQVEFRTARPPLTPDNRYNAMSLGKFLYGADVARGSADISLSLANQITSSLITNRVDGVDQYTSTGMELFTMPQTMVNANFLNNNSIHSQNILDKFQPFLSLISVDFDIAPSRGAMSYKTGNIKMKLHDRSRLADIAEFVRPELYGTNEIIVEYGWYHQEGEKTFGVRNSYADIFNGMRVKEKYGVINSNFSMNDAGEIDINLRVAMRGATDIDTEQIANNDAFRNQLQQIENLQRTISDLRQSVFGNSANNSNQPEIRGVQILDSAGDTSSLLTLSRDGLRELAELQRSLQAISRGNQESAAGKLNAKLRELLGSATATGGRRRGTESATGTSLISQLRTSISDQMKTKITTLVNGIDPIKQDAVQLLGLTADSNNSSGRRGRGQTAVSIDTGTQTDAERRALEQFQRRYSIDQSVTGEISLAKILLSFVGEPLAASGKFDDVQIVFYPFNLYAGTANRLNIGQFLVNAEYFYTKLVLWRYERAGQSLSISVRDFLEWLTANIVDDPMSRSYGISDLYKRTVDGDSENTVIGITTRDQDGAVYMQKLAEKLAHVTPNGEFRMPVIGYHIETSPGKLSTGTESVSYEDNKSILKIHIYDTLNTPFESLQQINNSRVDGVISSIGEATTDYRSAVANIEANQSAANARANTQENIAARRAVETNNQAKISSAAEFNRLVQQAREQNLLEIIPGSSPTRYRIVGGPDKLKKFFMENSPYIIYGAAGSTVKRATLSSQQNSQLSTINMLRSGQGTSVEPNGENPGGLPMRVIPTQLEIETIGCPYLTVGQKFFVDFNTGTTADNFYAVVGVSHVIEPGNFTSRIRMAPMDGYGQYINILTQITNFTEELNQNSVDEFNRRLEATFNSPEERANNPFVSTP